MVFIPTIPVGDRA